MSTDLLLVQCRFFDSQDRPLRGHRGGRPAGRDFRKAPLSFRVTEGPAIFGIDLKAKASEDLREVLEETFGWLEKHFDMSRVTAVDHRSAGSTLSSSRLASGNTAADPRRDM